MLTLGHNGQIVTTLYVGSYYELDTYVYGEPVLPQSWLVYFNSVVVASGSSSQVQFQALAAGSYQIEICARAPDGRGASETITLPAVARRATAANFSVSWSKSIYTPGEDLSARLYWNDPEGLPIRLLAWTLLKNGKQVGSGDTLSIKHTGASQGLYLLRAQAEDIYGNPVTAQFTAPVGLGFEIGACTSIPDPTETCVLLGSALTAQTDVPSGAALATPTVVASDSQYLYLLPGTTHVKFKLSADSQTAPDLSIIRTATGNWYVLKDGETFAGDVTAYQALPASVVPAPANLRLDLTVDTCALHASYSASSYRIEVECYRLGPKVYKYDPCAYSLKLGGAGPSGRRWAVIPSTLTLLPDVLGARWGVNTELTYVAPAVTALHYANLEPDGSPDPVNASTGYRFTEKNRAVVYESRGYPDIVGNATSALEGVRPFVLSLLKHNLPPELHRIKAITGELRVLVANGGVNAGSVITVKVLRINGLSDSYTLTANAAVSNSEDDYVLAGTIPISITDYEFGATGFIAEVTVNEVNAVYDSSGTEPLSLAEDQPAYSTQHFSALRVEGACYGNPEFQSIFEAGSVYTGTEVSSCGDSSCGPTGVYCYRQQIAPYEEAAITQPLHFPAPYVAPVGTPSRCFSHPSLLYEGSLAGTFTSYAEDTLCGDPYLYRDCLTQDELITVYPAATSPHAYAAYAGRVYALDSSFYGTAYGTLPVATASQVLPATSCTDAEFTGSSATGLSYLYFDTVTDEPVTVAFDVASTLGNYGVAHRAQASASLQPPGSKVVILAKVYKAPFLTVTANCTLIVETNATGIARTIQVLHNGSFTDYRLASGISEAQIPVAAGDVLWLNLGKYTERRFGRIAVSVRWKPLRDPVWKFDTAEMRNTQASVIQALGFCGAHSWAGYQYEGTLPADVVASTVLPEKTIVTVQSGSTDYVLLRTKPAQGDPPAFLSNMTWYGGQRLSGSLVFNFYSESDTGVHGEMDVWLDGTQADFPEYLNLGDNWALMKDNRSYRKSVAASDSSRANFQAASVSNAVQQSLYTGGTVSKINGIFKTNIHELYTSGTVLTSMGIDAGASAEVTPTFSHVVAWLSDFGIDTGSAPGAATQAAVANMVKSWSPTLIVSGGDIWQSGGVSFASLDRYLGKYYADYIYPYTGAYSRSGTAPEINRFITAFGNHDTDNSTRKALLKSYLGLSSETYALLHWPIHWFFVDDTDSNAEGELETGVTAQWLKKALYDSQAPWKVVVMHQAPYSSGGNHSSYVTRRWPFKAWGAHALFSGHDHIYERFNVNGLLAIVCGTMNNDSADGWDAEPAPYSVFGYGLPWQQGTCRITASNTEFKVEYVKLADGLVLDSTTLTK